MSKSFLLVLLAGVVAVGGYMALSNKGAIKDVVQEGQSQTPEGKKMAFGDFMKQGGSYMCTVENRSVEGIDSKGTVYLGNGMIRVDATTKISGASDFDSSLIVTNDYTYTWTSQTGSMGFKTKTVKEVSANTGADSGQYSFDASQIGDYSCEPWSVDASKFVPPATIKFTDMSGGN